jgi:hypothetical protein
LARLGSHAGEVQMLAFRLHGGCFPAHKPVRSRCGIYSYPHTLPTCGGYGISGAATVPCLWRWPGSRSLRRLWLWLLNLSGARCAECHLYGGVCRPGNLRPADEMSLVTSSWWDLSALVGGLIVYRARGELAPYYAAGGAATTTSGSTTAGTSVTLTSATG